MIITKPVLAEVPEYYRGYTNLVSEENLFDAFSHSMDETLALYDSIPADREDYRYAPGKWSVREVARHLNDAERVFAYRALRFSRRDATPLPGFDENHYAPNANASGCRLEDIADEFRAIRNTTILLFRHMTVEMLGFTGTANGCDFSARTVGWIMAGHNLHHLGVLRDRYL